MPNTSTTKIGHVIDITYLNSRIATQKAGKENPRILLGFRLFRFSRPFFLPFFQQCKEIIF